MFNKPWNSINQMHNSISKILAAFIILLYGCNTPVKDKSTVLSTKNAVWYKQYSADLGSRINMFSDDNGLAITKGKGTEVNGSALEFKKGKWQLLDQFDYSDYPVIKKYNETEYWYLIHSTHMGNYEPHLYSFSKGKKKEIPLPKIMWDEKDYCMWTSLSILKNGKAWMVGQQGNIIKYDGNNWSVEPSPVKKYDNGNLLSGDLNDVQMLSDNSGWAVGKQGIILKYSNGIWKRFFSPTENELCSISMVDENFGWIVGDRGTILQYNLGEWKNYKSDFRQSYTSVKAVNPTKAWITGGRSLLLEFNDGKWAEDRSIKIFDDNFEDIDVIKANDGSYKIWIIGNNGIYSNSQSLKFSYTDITSQASLRKEGRAGFFADINNDGLPDLLTIIEDGPSLLFENRQPLGFRQNSQNSLSSEINNLQTIAAGDINNDGNIDLLELLDDLNYKLLFGNCDFSFRKADSSFLHLNTIQSDMFLTSASFIDFDNDGNLDLYISNYNNTDMLFSNSGTGKFTNVFSNTGIKKNPFNKSYSTIFSDYNNDGLTDILITYKIPEEDQHVFLYLNKGNFKFSEKKGQSFFTSVSQNTYSAISADFNNDGYQDVLVFNNDKNLKLLLNKGDASFTEVAEQAGLTGIFSHPEPSNGILNAADINNDGWIDLFIGSRLFLNSPGMKFTEISKYIGIDFTGNPSFSDVDNDGDMDLFIGSSREALGKGDRAVLFRNNLIEPKYFKVKLFPDISNRSGIGSKIFLECYNNKGELAYTASRQTGLGASAITPPEFSSLLFGADPGYKYNLRVVFPSGIEQRFTNLKLNSTLNVYESSLYEHNLILAIKSLKRTLLLYNPITESLKLLIVLLILFSMYRYGIKTKARKIIKQWYLATFFIALYLFLVHLNITLSPLPAAFYSIGITSVVAFGFISLSVFYFERKESRYISHYKLLEILGSGGMGKVYKAIDKHNNLTVAVKLLNQELLKDEENRKILQSEGRLLSSLDHPNIVKVYEFGENKENVFIAMEYLPGGTLHDYINRNYPLPYEQIIDFAKQILNGLSEIHKNNIIHRDLKSPNIMLDECNNLRIMDFGISKSPLVSTMTSMGTVLGTLGFTAPEQVTNTSIDKRADIFSFGVIFYQLLAGQLPFNGENEIALIYSIFNTQPPAPSSLNSSATVKLDAIVTKCINKDPAHRYSSADEIINELEILYPAPDTGAGIEENYGDLRKKTRG